MLRRQCEGRNSLCWSGATVTDLVNHVLEHIAWLLDFGKIDAGTVTVAWLDRGSRDSRAHCGAIKQALAKIHAKMYVDDLVQNLPDANSAKSSFQTVLRHFRSYAVFSKVF